MKFFILFSFLFFTNKIFSAEKVYTIENTSPEIIIGTKEAALEKEKKNRYKVKRPSDLWSVALSRTSMRFHLPSFQGAQYSFSPKSLGLSLGHKKENKFYLYQGYYEYSLEYQKLERGTTYKQALSLYQVNFFQNFDIAWVKKHSLFFSAGVGVAPLFLTTEQSILGNSTTDFGYLIMFKLNTLVPFKNYYEVDFSLKTGWGNASGHEISLTSLNLGLNFE